MPQALEEQNSELLDKNLALAETLESTTALHKTAESTGRQQLIQLEAKTREHERATRDLALAQSKLREGREEQQRLTELVRELQESRSEVTRAGEAGADDTMGEELESALAGSGPASITQLKLKIRQLEQTLARRVPAAVPIPDQASIPQPDEKYLTAQREVLRLQGILEDIMSGDSGLGDG